jgi:hypothetical protein
MKNKKFWTYTEHSSALADTGDYEYWIQFTNGDDILQTSGCELEEEDVQQFCDLLNKMSDLWSHKNDCLEFELSQANKKIKHLEEALINIRDASYNEEYNDKEKIDDLKSIAFNYLFEINNNLF